MGTQFNEQSLAALMNPAVLAGCLAAVFLIGYFCARRYKNTNDFMKSTKLYAVIILFALVVFFLLEVPVILCIGYALFGFVMMALFSNHYFNK